MRRASSALLIIIAVFDGRTEARLHEHVTLLACIACPMVLDMQECDLLLWNVWPSQRPRNNMVARMSASAVKLGRVPPIAAIRMNILSESLERKVSLRDIFCIRN